MPKPLREKHGESSATKKSVEKVQKEEEPLKKEQPSEEVPKKVDKHQASEPEHKPDISKEVIPETSPHEAPSASQSAEKESAQNGVSQGEKMTGTQVIVAREKNVPVESRTGWYWFFAALGVLLLTFFWLA
jgi:hypothetical protein